MMGYWVRLTEDGTPDNYSGSWFEGAEWIEKVSSTELDTCRWTGKAWVEREQVEPYEPTPEEIEAQREAEYQERLEAWQASVTAAIYASDAKRALDWGGMTLTAYRAAAQDIRNSMPMPER